MFKLTINTTTSTSTAKATNSPSVYQSSNTICDVGPTGI